MTPDLAYLKRLKAAADAAIIVVRGEWIKSGSGLGAINWADLRCRETAYIVNDDEVEWCRVLIAAADPHAMPFHTAIRRALLEAGFMELIEVETEW
jgi:hypothetical protein